MRPRTTRRVRAIPPPKPEPQSQLPHGLPIMEPADPAPTPYVLDIVFKKLGGQGWFLEGLEVSISRLSSDTVRIDVVGLEPRFGKAWFTMDNRRMVRYSIPPRSQGEHKHNDESDLAVDNYCSRAAAAAGSWLDERRFLPTRFKVRITPWAGGVSEVWSGCNICDADAECKYIVTILPPPYDPHDPYIIVFLKEDCTVVGGFGDFSPF